MYFSLDDRGLPAGRFALAHGPDSRPAVSLRPASGVSPAHLSLVVLIPGYGTRRIPSVRGTAARP